jgi:hypothetical protein
VFLYYQDESVHHNQEFHQGTIIDIMVEFSDTVHDSDDENRDSILLDQGGILVSQDSTRSQEDINATVSRYGAPEQVEWVTPVTVFNRHKGASLHYGSQGGVLKWAYGEVCLVVRIGKAGERLGYPTVAELEKGQQHH